MCYGCLELAADLVVTAAQSTTPFIARGINVSHPIDDHDLFHAINEHRATPEQLQRLVTNGGKNGAGIWWGTYDHPDHPDPHAYGGFEDFAIHSGEGANPELSVANYHDSGEYHERKAEYGKDSIFAEVPVVMVGQRPKRGKDLWDPEIHNPSEGLMGNSYLDDNEEVPLHEIHYHSGRDWVKVPMPAGTKVRTAGTYYHRSVNPVGESSQRYPHTYFYQADDPYGVDYETQGYGDHIYQTDIDDSLMEPDPAPRRAPNGAPWFRTSPENVGELTHIHDPTQPFGQPRRKRTSHIHSERIGKVQFPYLRNNGGMRHVPGFDQETEPWGRYMSPDADEHHLPLQQGWERGQVDFDNPLYVPHNYGAWKQELSQAHGGLTGQALSDALLAKGHDGVVTHDKYGIGEIVDIRPKNQRGHRVA